MRWGLKVCGGGRERDVTALNIFNIEILLFPYYVAVTEEVQLVFGIMTGCSVKEL